MRLQSLVFASLAVFSAAGSARAAREIPAHEKAEYKRFGRDAARVIAVLRSTPGTAEAGARLHKAFRGAMSAPGRIVTNTGGHDMTRGTDEGVVRINVDANRPLMPGILALSITHEHRNSSGMTGYRSAPGSSLKVSFDRRLGNLTEEHGTTTSVR